MREAVLPSAKYRQLISSRYRSYYRDFVLRGPSAHERTEWIATWKPLFDTCRTTGNTRPLLRRLRRVGDDAFAERILDARSLSWRRGSW